MLTEAAESKPDERLSTVAEFRMRLMNVHSRLSDFADMDKELDSEGFRTALSDYLDLPIVVAEENLMFRSASGRTRVAMMWKDRDVHFAFDPVGSHQPTSASARAALMRRIDETTKNHSERGRFIRTASGSGSLSFALKVERLARTPEDARVVAHAVADIFALLDQATVEPTGGQT